jgi:hypothetical protein
MYLAASAIFRVSVFFSFFFSDKDDNEDPAYKTSLTSSSQMPFGPTPADRPIQNLVLNGRMLPFAPNHGEKWDPDKVPTTRPLSASHQVKLFRHIRSFFAHLLTTAYPICFQLFLLLDGRPLQVTIS